MKFLNYDERPDFPPEAAEYHARAAAMAASVKGTDYAFGPHTLQRLTVFPATKPTGEVFLALHGGRWRHGYREHMAPFAPPLNRLGITVVTAGYRLAPQNPFPDGLHDCGLALKWIAEHLSSFGGKANAIFVGGHSAGAHYAALLTVRPEAASVDSLPRIAGCLPVSGVFLVGPDTVPGPILFPNGATADEYAVASPLDANLRGSAPFHITLGSEDHPIVQRDSADFVKALETAGVEVETLVLEGCGHFDAGLEVGTANSVWVESAQKFMKTRPARI